jgi:hypothetical protein
MLARAARHFDCDLPLVRRTNEERARAALVRHMGNHLPALLCVDEWDHWITVVRHEQQRFVILDSRHEPVLQVVEWIKAASAASTAGATETALCLPPLGVLTRRTQFPGARAPAAANPGA